METLNNLINLIFRPMIYRQDLQLDYSKQWSPDGIFIIYSFSILLVKTNKRWAKTSGRNFRNFNCSKIRIFWKFEIILIFKYESFENGDKILSFSESLTKRWAFN